MQAYQKMLTIARADFDVSDDNAECRTVTESRWCKFSPQRLGTTDGLTRCWFYNTSAGISGGTRVSEGCKDGMFYSTDRTDQTTSRSDYGQCKAYVTKLDALYAARLEAQADCAKRLRQIDAMIEAEQEPA